LKLGEIVIDSLRVEAEATGTLSLDINGSVSDLQLQSTIHICNSHAIPLMPSRQRRDLGRIADVGAQQHRLISQT
jgi:hypothetical protein